MRLVAGIFVGGRASRLGGIAKGLLPAPDGEPIVVRTRRLLESLGAECVLVGAHPGYRELELATIEDAPGVEGPLAGLLALLEQAKGRVALAVACDMPLVTRDLLERLVAAPAAPVVAPRHAVLGRGREIWEPLFARYDSASVLPIARAFADEGGRKLQLLLDAAGARALELLPSELLLLHDWDQIEDLPADLAARLPCTSRRGKGGA